MLIQEAKWLGGQLERLSRLDVFPMLNVGSSTADFRNRRQPYVNNLIFEPALRKGHSVVHLDIKEAPGVDIVGDLSNPHFLKKVCEMKFNSVFCSNLLEHVLERQQICQTLVQIVPEGGYLFISVPFSYPYHPDPMDSMFRPSVSELCEAFPGTEAVASEVVVGDTFLRLRMREPLVFILTLARCFLPFYKPVSWWRNGGYLPWFFRRVSASCVVLRKKSTLKPSEPT